MPEDFTHVFDPASEDDPITLLLLHGTGANERDLLGLGRALSPTAALLSPLGKVREHGMPRWFARHGEGVLDEDDVRRRTTELADWVRDDALARYERSAAGVIAVGFSNGANVAAASFWVEPGWLRGAVLLSPMLPFRPETAPPLDDLGGVPILMGAGRRDPIAAPAEAQQLVDLLAAAGAQVDVAWHDGGHTVAIEQVRAGVTWLETVRDTLA